MQIWFLCSLLDPPSEEIGLFYILNRVRYIFYLSLLQIIIYSFFPEKSLDLFYLRTSRSNVASFLSEKHVSTSHFTLSEKREETTILFLTTEEGFHHDALFSLGVPIINRYVVQDYSHYISAK